MKKMVIISIVEALVNFAAIILTMITIVGLAIAISERSVVSIIILYIAFGISFKSALLMSAGFSIFSEEES